MGCLHDHVMPKGVSLGLVKVDILDMKLRFVSNFIHVKLLYLYY